MYVKVNSKGEIIGGILKEPFTQKGFQCIELLGEVKLSLLRANQNKQYPCDGYIYDIETKLFKRSKL